MSRNLADIRPEIDTALRILGIKHFLLGIHDPAFPGLPEEDIGRGSPYSSGAADFLAFIRGLGFNGIQLGPQGITTPANPSPYDGTLFSRNPLSLAPHRLSRDPWKLLAPEKAASLTIDSSFPGDRVHDAFARNAVRQCTDQICREYLQEKEVPQKAHTSLHHYYNLFRQHNEAWLERDALYELLRERHGGKNWLQWPENGRTELDRKLFAQPRKSRTEAAMRIDSLHRLHGGRIECYKFIQFLLNQQHQEFRKYCRSLGLKLYGDCQIGISSRDAWYAQSFLLEDYVMGAPPSRTNPEGQPWNYPVLDPRQYYRDGGDGTGLPGPAVRFFQARIDKLFEEFDGLRIDHPHGLVCPWVYRSGSKDPVQAVQQGARLFASPDLPDHPELAEFAIPRPEQIDRSRERHDDNYVADLDPDQVSRYAVLFDIIMDSARRHGCSSEDIACEILSTQPYPIKRVMDLYGLGRFRVTQKADLNNPADVYRSENAKPEDWMMAGNHDTPSLWRRAAEWIESGTGTRQAAYLAERLRIPEGERTEWMERTASDPGALAQAKFADLFIGPARNIMVFFTDLLGFEQDYNKPGTVSRINWSLRVPHDYRKRYIRSLENNRALNIPKALALALRARGHCKSAGDRNLIGALESKN